MFVRPTAVDEPLLLLETLSACLAGLGLGVDNATCKQVLIVRAKVDHAIKRQTSKLQCRSLTRRNVKHQHVSSELHKEIFVQATNTMGSCHSVCLVLAISSFLSWAPDGKILKTLLPYISDFLLD
jgi:hypothetical protein